MKKTILVFLIILYVSCSIDDPDYRYKLLPIQESETPQSFKFGEVDTIKVKYTLPNTCFSFHSLYYEYRDTTRIVAIRTLEKLEETCQEISVERELKFPVKVSQKEDYIFKFWKGKDSDGKDIFEEKIVLVEE
ncbi:hypothetical protein WH52_04865 [Tenacibaculum holothuriorum]|uniref:Uncharacterized protein n=1 Tax=Tenacibaculum holothuriorum TaxID=1635173 RepID=A0A1Y2PEY0_9FLAO|nr:hypothetical protein [Tenacibaculum holothuriorum]OSY88995.1 hypothetical protein WH52_04865 [Tenacibaculum holothuriorum]